MRSRTVTAIATIAIASMAFAEDATVPVLLSGIGRLSCKNWKSTPALENEGNTWLLGFWTALNYVAATADQQQVQIRGQAIVSEVAKTCARNPSETLATAAWETFFEQRKAVH
jgi:hypothetical protein